MSQHCFATVDLIAKAVYGLVSYDVLTNTRENAILGLRNVNFEFTTSHENPMLSLFPKLVSF